MQEDQFKEKGRYQENQENLAIFAIKERYMNAVPQCPVCNLLFITCLLSCTQGYGSGGALFQLSILHSTQGTQNLAQFSESRVSKFHQLLHQKLGYEILAIR